MKENYRKRYFENHLLEIKADGKNHAKKVLIYTGTWIRWKLNLRKMSILKNIYFWFLIINITVFLFSGLQYHPVNELWFVSIPALISLVPLLLEIIGIIQFLFLKKTVTSFDYKEIHKRIYFGSLFHSIFLLLTAGACIVAITKIGASLNTLAITCGYLFCGFCSGIVFFLHQRLKFEEIPEPFQIS
jgi:hypothetical protein